MNKIGIAIRSTSQGAGGPICVNDDGKWSKGVVDCRDLLKLIPDNQAGGKREIVFMSFSETGCYITIMHGTKSRLGDNVSGWIYIPNTIEIKGEKVIALISVVREIVSNDTLPSDLKNSFSDVYPLKNGPVFEYSSSKPLSAGIYAKRDINRNSKKELLGEKRYQSYYADYSCVILSDNVAEIQGAVDLTNSPLVEMVTVNPSNVINALGLGNVILTSKDDKYFRNPILWERDKPLRLIAKKGLFKTEPFEIRVGENGTINPPSNVSLKKEIKYSDFQFFDSSNKSIHGDFDIEVNNDRLFGRTVKLTEEECRLAKVTIIPKSNPDYAKTDVQISLSGSAPYKITVRYKEISGVISGRNGNLKITLEGRKLDMSNPLKGYSFDGREFKYNPPTGGKELLKGLAIPVVVTFVLICGAGLWSYNNWKPEEPKKSNVKQLIDENKRLKEDVKELKSEINSLKSKNEPQTSGENSDGQSDLVQKAISYLRKEKWTKKDLDSNDLTKGLFEELNSFGFQALLDRKDVLNGSENFQKLIDIIVQNKLNNNDACVQFMNRFKEKKQGRRTYNVNNGSKDSFEITLNTYIETLINYLPSSTPKVEKKPSNPQSSKKAGNESEKSPDSGTTSSPDGRGAV
jgi:hypothetical protein